MNAELDVLHLVLNASIPVQIVMAILLGFSIASWFIIFRKKTMIDRANRDAGEFEDRFWSGADLAGLFKEVTSDGERITGTASIFEAGFREFARLRQRRSVDSRSLLEGAQRAMRVASARETERLEQSLEFLANVGSISPYVGLFGTVWGIMIAFHGLANVKEASIAMVAPGITEALIATAMGLFAAIPAVWAYNRYANKIERISLRYDTFVEEFSSILARQAPHDEAV
ncbi:MAG: protein TolQ [Dokdonella sp.]|jgi:biopolymer transport protein TolQ|uniref:Tol-Pal system protein TolQ n=1 Tax=Rhodanobacter denitrificans TaxID=666685 RepID=A0A2W5KN96_9GAMM|nr:protein TolQ [Dokdonella sp.]PZQ18522.1 MAG: protein TolQ [Rhodanobacter denitrificans]